MPGTQYDVDSKNRVMLAEGNHVLTRVFACGVGYPVRTKEDHSKGNSNPTNWPRADSFSLYMNLVADNILKNMLPKCSKRFTSHLDLVNECWYKPSSA